MIDLLRVLWAGVAGFLLAIIIVEYSLFDITNGPLKIVLCCAFFALMAFGAISSIREKAKAHG